MHDGAKLSRRRFLTLATAAVGFPTIVPASALGRDGKVAPSNRVTMGFIDCVLSRKEPIAPVETAHRSITICHLGNIAMRLNREKLRWDPKKERILGDDEASKMLKRTYRGDWKL